MRIEPIAPSNLSADQRPLYETMRASIASMSGFDAFTTAREDGALLGPFNPWLHEPTICKAVWDLTEAISSDSKLPPRCRQIAILVTGARFSAAYELYAHTAVALKIGMAKDFVAALVAGEKPVGIAGDEALVYDISALLASGRVLPQLDFELAAAAFGARGVAELVYLVGLYCFVSTTLNGFDIPVPGTR